MLIFLKLFKCLVMVWRCSCLNIVFKLIFVTLFLILYLIIFQPLILSKCIYSGYLVSATPLTVLCQQFWTCIVVFFCYGLKMCMWFHHLVIILTDWSLSLFLHFELNLFPSLFCIFTLSFFELQFYQTVYIVGTFGGFTKGGGNKFSEFACSI